MEWLENSNFPKYAYPLHTFPKYAVLGNEIAVTIVRRKRVTTSKGGGNVEFYPEDKLIAIKLIEEREILEIITILLKVIE